MLIDLKFTLITETVIGYNKKNKFVHVQVVSAAIQCLLPSSNCKIPFTIKKTHYFREGVIIIILYVS